jgi:hypothetical protein
MVRVGVGAGAVGFHRQKNKLMVTRSFYTPNPLGIKVEFIDKAWVDYKTIVKRYDARACIRHVVEQNRSDFGVVNVNLPAKPSPGDLYENTLDKYLTNKRIFALMRKHNSKNLWFYCRFVKFEATNGKAALLPIAWYQGSPDGNKMLTDFIGMQKKETDAQLEKIGQNLQQILKAQQVAWMLMPKGAFGPEPAALGQGGNKAFVLQQLQRGIVWKFQENIFRQRYVHILSIAR